MTSAAQVTNDGRAENAREVLQEYAQQAYSLPVDRDLTNPETFAMVASDFLSDFMHLCDRSGEPGRSDGELFHSLLGRAVMHYRDEMDEEAQPPTPDLRVV